MKGADRDPRPHDLRRQDIVDARPVCLYSLSSMVNKDPSRQNLRGRNNKSYLVRQPKLPRELQFREQPWSFWEQWRGCAGRGGEERVGDGTGRGRSRKNDALCWVGINEGPTDVKTRERIRRPGQGGEHGQGETTSGVKGGRGGTT